MNDADYIRRGVELAEGWHVTPDDCVTTDEFGALAHPSESEILLDALAAQLRRQCRAKGVWADILVSRLGSELGELGADYDEAMHDIRDIVDSKVLEGGE